MRFNAQSLGNVLDAFGMGSRTNMDELNPHFKGGFFNRETFDAAHANLDEAGKKQAGDLGDALDFAFGRNSKEYTQEALNNAGEAYRKNGQVGLGNFATPTHSSSFLMERFGDTAMGAAFGGAAIGGIAGAAMGNDPGESSVYGGLAGAAMFGIGRGLRNPAFMETMERRAISSIMGKSHDELVADKQAVYRTQLDEGLEVERINQEKKSTDAKVNEHRQAQLNAIERRGGLTKEESAQKREIENTPKQIQKIEQEIAERQRDEVIGIDRRTNQPVTKSQFDTYSDDEKKFAVNQFDESSMSRDEYIKQRQESIGHLTKEEQDVFQETMNHPTASNIVTTPVHEVPPLGKVEGYTPPQHFELNKDLNSSYINADVSEAEYQRYMSRQDQTLTHLTPDGRTTISRQGDPNERVLSVRGKDQKPGEITENPNHPQNQIKSEEQLKKEKTERNKLALEKKKEFEKQREKEIKNLEQQKNGDSEFDKTLDKQIQSLKNQDSREVGIKRANREIKRNKESLKESETQKFQNQLNYLDEEAAKKGESLKTYEFLDQSNRETIHQGSEPFTFTQERAVTSERAEQINAKKEITNDRLREEETLAEKHKANLRSANDLDSQFSSKQEIYSENRNVSQDALDKSRLDDVEIRKRMLSNRQKGYEELSKEEKDLFRKETDEYFVSEGNLSDNIDYEKIYNEGLFNPKEKLNQVYGSEYDKIIQSQKQAKAKQAELEKQKNDLIEKNNSQSLDESASVKYTASPITSSVDPKKIEQGEMKVINPMLAALEKGGPGKIDLPLSKERLRSQGGSLIGERVISPMTPISEGTQDLLNKTRSTTPKDLNAHFSERTAPLANKELLQEAATAKPSSFMGKQAQKLLRSGPDHNVGMQTRHMVLGGSMLAGAAFGSKRKDHSRGFNSHRGNRI